jgi:cysteine synthase
MELSNVRTSHTLMQCAMGTVVSSMLFGIVIGWMSHRISYPKMRQKQSSVTTNITAYELLIGNTPCILLPKLSQLLQRQVYLKLENYNPGGSGKDRAAFNMIIAAEKSGKLPLSKQNGVALNDLTLYPKLDLKHPSNSPAEKFDTIIMQAIEQSITGGLVVEGTSGSTGISLAALAIAKGHGCLVILPNDQAAEKQQLLQSLGAVVHVVPTGAISNPQHYVNIAKAISVRAVELGIPAVFVDQFNNLDNYRIHYTTTGPEIWEQCEPHAFVMSAGTGGTITGVAKYLKEQNSDCHVVLADPIGSVLYSKIEHGVAFTSQQKESKLLRHRYDTIAEGIGLDRITQNMKEGLPYIDSAITVTDQDMVDMAHYILQEEGLMLGSSSAVNIVATIQTAIQLPVGSRVCTVMCDTGQRHVTRFWNRDFITSRGLEWPLDNVSHRRPQCLQSFLI